MGIILIINALHMFNYRDVQEGRRLLDAELCVTCKNQKNYAFSNLFQFASVWHALVLKKNTSIDVVWLFWTKNKSKQP